MVELTVGVASACIAAGIAVFQFILPNALALILTGLLSEEQPAVTWSVVSRFFLSTDWPLFLRSEAATASGTSGAISVVTWTKPLGLLLIAIAAIVTPLGLYDELAPGSAPDNVQFVYVADTSLIGIGTPARSDRGYEFSRLCSGFLCPGDPDQGNVTFTQILNFTTNETGPISYRIVPESMSPKVIDLYQSGSQTNSPSLAGYFDIQARQWTTWTDTYVQDNGSLIEADYKYLSPLFMDNKLELVEGLIVDTKSGGIGFRNHSVPATYSAYGVEWDEDILWMQPETTCVDTNLTLSFTWEGISSSMYGYADVVDNGGFCSLQKVNPYYTQPNTTQEYVFDDAQRNPWLYERAFLLAWTHNARLMEYMNITDPLTNRSRVSSSMGQVFNVNGSLNTVGTSSYSNDFFKLTRAGQIVSMPDASSWNETNQNYTYNPNPLLSNPYNVTNDLLSSGLDYIKGALGGDHVNISTLDIGAGFIAGPAFRLNKTDPTNSSSPETWQRPYYACASATKISIKTVRMRYNSTRDASLNNLEIMDIRDKTYARESDKPLWGLETPWLNETTTWNFSMIEPLWGIMDPSTPPSREITLFQSERLYLPASFESYQKSGWGSDYIYTSYTPGTTGASQSWNLVFNPQLSSDPYLGNDPQQQRFFRDMTTNATVTSKLLNILWTDIAANAMVGTRGVHQPRYTPLSTQARFRRSLGDLLSSSDSEELPDGHYPVYVLRRRIRYDWVYGIPAFLCLSIVAGVVMLAIIAMIFGRGTATKLKWYLFNISSGRILASYVYPETANQKSTETKQWLEVVGKRPIVISSASRYTTGFEAQELRTMQKGAPQYVKVQSTEEVNSISSVWDAHDDQKRLRP